ncbi:MAG: gliding motility-associated C-terminal domain-containing protein [Bacteroidota bacterium]
MKRILPFVLLVLLLSAGTGYAQSGNIFGGGNETTAKENGSVFIPNAFTPNGDGVNDYFYIPEANLTSFNFSVFDRWGNEVFKTNNANFRWDGRSKGNGVPSGIYVFVLDARNTNNDRVKRSGTISVVR